MYTTDTFGLAGRYGEQTSKCFMYFRRCFPEGEDGFGNVLSNVALFNLLTETNDLTIVIYMSIDNPRSEPSAALGLCLLTCRICFHIRFN